ncbi:MAG: 2-oxoglutarate dehydrogenase E1 component [Verrucomicrobia bacterium]|nr:MAG: 2-oxoglutarate dehydrogenase E1 component [Verrucomicrobiota bacterium]
MNSSFTARWNEALLDENYRRWQQDPQSVGADWKAFFEGFELGAAQPGNNGIKTGDAALVSQDADAFQTKVDALIAAYRTLGHSAAKIDPLAEKPREQPLLSLENLGFEKGDLDKTVRGLAGKQMTLRDLIRTLEKIYCGTVGVEFMYIQDPQQRNWILSRLEDLENQEEPDYRGVLRTIYEAETFEHFLHSNYVGHKRFSVEGGESLLVSLKAILNSCENADIRVIALGMAHRGRLNVLANFLQKPLEMIFNEFSDNIYVPDCASGSGDVKYHLGYQTLHKTASNYEVQIDLAANPSHLEAVDPVVQGKARALQRIFDDTRERKKVVPVLVHGDAAFAAQGVVAETFNMSQLPGYRVGGTVHIVVNNQIGFTTLPADARSTPYCTDIAKMVEAPIFHVNGEDPLTVATVTRIALEFRQKFGRDVVIDITCFRRHGHNEADEPSFTQPNLYNRIKAYPLLSDVFLKELQRKGVIQPEEAAALKSRELKELEEALAHVKASEAQKKENEKDKTTHERNSKFAGSTAIFQPSYSHEPVNTAIDTAMLAKIVRALTTVPDGFRVLPKIRRMLLERRHKIWKEGGPYDWSFAEALAFGSLLLEKVPVRLSGQDSRRGTFSHRHSVLYDEINRERYIPLDNLGPEQAKFCVYNSPLSEYAVLGFDYGYSLDFPSMLCLWEAQFGDFFNGAQIMVDQFIASAEAKWQRPSSLVMLLPHGYEGQGPEHTSARLERFLQLCAEENMQVCNLTTPAQYFHVLRRQIHRGYRKPLVIMTPKSLLRAEEAVSKAEDFTHSRFFEILDSQGHTDPDKVERVIFCSGKVYYDLFRYRAAHQLADSVALIRIEQLYPLYEEELGRIFSQYRGVSRVVWCQEESQNMGAWSFIFPRLQKLLKREILYAGRLASASPATGSATVHKRQQADLVEAAFGV